MALSLFPMDGSEIKSWEDGEEAEGGGKAEG
jgi:hypothetical protein